jgi:hypothetical protein
MQPGEKLGVGGRREGTLENKYYNFTIKIVTYFVPETGSISAAILHFLKVSQEGIRHTLTFICIFAQKCPAVKVMGLTGGRYFSLKEFIFHLLSP